MGLGGNRMGVRGWQNDICIVFFFVFSAILNTFIFSAENPIKILIFINPSLQSGNILQVHMSPV